MVPYAQYTPQANVMYRRISVVEYVLQHILHAILGYSLVLVGYAILLLALNLPEATRFRATVLGNIHTTFQN